MEALLVVAMFVAMVRTVANLLLPPMNVWVDWATMAIWSYLGLTWWVGTTWQSDFVILAPGIMFLSQLLLVTARRASTVVVDPRARSYRQI